MSTSPHMQITTATPQPEDGTDTDNGLQVETGPVALTGERLLAAQAMQLLIRLDKDLMEARAQWNQDWFRRVMRTRQRAALRLQRRWKAINPPPKIVLGNLRRRFHANIAMYLYPSRES